ncbi:MAG: hypothetical protein ACRCUB_02600 [Plesiomonas shigelloides]
MRKKKYNRNKWVMHQTKKILDAWAVCFMSGEDNCFVMNLDTHKQLEAIDPELADVIILNRHKWDIYLFALCVDDFGKPYIKPGELTVSDSVTHTELLPYLNDAHAALCKGCNPRHFVRPAWMAYAGSRSIDINKELPAILDMLERRGGFEQCAQKIETEVME